MKGKGGKRGTDQTSFGLWFLLSVSVLYLLLWSIFPERVQVSFDNSLSLLMNILPVLLVVLLFMVLVNQFLKPSWAKKHLGEGSGAKGWVLAVITGILSHGPVYVWFPLLKDLREHGVKNGLIAVFLYNRSIKIPLLPVMVYYFGALFVVVLLVVMVPASILEGRLMDLMEERFDRSGSKRG